MKKISFLMVLLNLFMFWGEQPPIVLAVAFLFSLLCFVDHWILKSWVKTLVSAGLLGIGLVIMRMTFSPFLSAESLIALIIFLASLKLFELKTETDYFHLF